MNYILPPQTCIGHVHLKVSDIEQSLAFYCGILGFEVTMRWGSQAAFISAGGYHHHIGLNTWHSEGAPAPPSFSTGLYHAAILLPDRVSLSRAYRQLLEHGYPITGAADHGVSEALYLNDPDGNGLELYWDRPEAAWPKDAQGGLAMYTHPLDLERLLRESA